MYWTNYAENRILRVFRGETLAAPAELYVALYMSNPGETGAGTEIQYPGYQRRKIAFTPPAADTGGTAIMNTEDISFATSSTAAGTVTHVALFDSIIGGNMWAYNTLDEQIPVLVGIAPFIQAQEWHYVTSGHLSAAFKVAALNVLRGVNLPGFLPYIALYNGDPDNGGAELSGGNYARFAVTFGAPEVQPAGQSMIAVSAPASSQRANALWGTLTHIALCTAASSGEVAAFIQQDYEYIVGASSAIFIDPGDLTISLN